MLLRIEVSVWWKKTINIVCTDVMFLIYKERTNSKAQKWDVGVNLLEQQQKKNEGVYTIQRWR